MHRARLRATVLAALALAVPSSACFLSIDPLPSPNAPDGSVDGAPSEVPSGDASVASSSSSGGGSDGGSASQECAAFGGGGCVCSGVRSCTIECTASQCEVVCAGGASCDVHCVEQCDVSCSGAGTTCKVRGPQAGCTPVSGGTCS